MEFKSTDNIEKLEEVSKRSFYKKQIEDKNMMYHWSKWNKRDNIYRYSILWKTNKINFK